MAALLHRFLIVGGTRCRTGGERNSMIFIGAHHIHRRTVATYFSCTGRPSLMLADSPPGVRTAERAGADTTLAGVAAPPRSGAAARLPPASRGSRAAAGTLAAALLFACACAPEPVAPEAVLEPMYPLVGVHMGSAIAPGGTVPEHARRDDFYPGETIFLSATLRNMEGRAVTATWRGPGGLPLGRETRTVPAGGTVHFSTGRTEAWIPGDYDVTLRAGSKTIAAEELHILGEGPQLVRQP